MDKCSNLSLISIKNLFGLMNNLQLLVLQGCSGCCRYSSGLDEPLTLVNKSELLVNEPKCFLPRLKEIKLVDIKGCPFELLLIKYILENARLLEFIKLQNVSPPIQFPANINISTGGESESAD